MSSTQQQKSVDLIEFCTNSNDNMDVLDKPNTGVVQKMVMSETASASLIATAVAKLTTSSVTTAAPSVTNSPLNKSESDSISSNQKLDNVTGNVDTVIITTTMSSITKAADATPLNETNPRNPSQVMLIRPISTIQKLTHQKNYLLDFQLTILILVSFLSFGIFIASDTYLSYSSMHYICIHFQTISRFRFRFHCCWLALVYTFVHV